MSRAQEMCVSVGKGTRFDLEAIAPVAAAQTLHAVAPHGKISWLPLFEHVAELVQHQPRIIEELVRRAAQIDTPAPSGGDGARMQPRVERMLDDAHVRHRLTEHGLQRPAERIRKRNLASGPHDASV